MYPALEEHWSAQFPPNLTPVPGQKLMFERGVITITKDGSQFIAACHQK
jgi:hypothetical protein